MWQQEQNPERESLHWKHGKITIGSYLKLDSPKDNSILITTEPFDKEPYLSELSPWSDRKILVPSGEEFKNLEQVHKICQELLKHNVNRETTVYVLGGGVLLDMAGFATSIYMRGIKKVIYVPTTLLSAVDATVGGKTGINWSGAKNMLGTIRHAKEIIISLHYLRTLDERHFINGIAECIKMAITHDPALFQMFLSHDVTVESLRSSDGILKEIIKKSLEIKTDVVEQDQFDNTGRQWLNFGHTIGHALELSSEGPTYYHGEWVSVGMIQEMKIGEAFGYVKNKEIIKQIETVLKKFRLPTEIPENISFHEFIPLMTLDKKSTSKNEINLTLISGIGKRLETLSPVSLKDLYRFYLGKEFVEIGSQALPLEELKNNIKRVNERWMKEGKFPGSKSLSIRYLFLAALEFLKNKEIVILKNYLEADDTICLKNSLKSIGFSFEEQPEQKIIKAIGYEQKSKGVLDVGNSGLTARFIAILCAFLPGEWTINCHKRMSERPNLQIFNICREVFNCEIEFLEKAESFPIRIVSSGNHPSKNVIEISSNESSQFISSVMLNSLIWNKKTEIICQKPIVSEPYVLMTAKCLEKFGAETQIIDSEKNVKFVVIPNKQSNSTNEIEIELDLSSFSYPYALSLLLGAKPPKLPSESIQGDKKFYTFCNQYQNGILPSELNFSECTDTFMTMSVLIASNIVSQRNQSFHLDDIGNQRVKECNRINFTCKNLCKLSIPSEETENGLRISPQNIYEIGKEVQRKGNIIVFETEGDHRMAMSFALLSIYLALHCNNHHALFVVDDKNAVNKTFPRFWEYLSEIGVSFETKKGLSQENKHKNNQVTNIKSVFKPEITVVLGNRGCGKTTLSQKVSERTNKKFVDLDSLITNYIKEKYGIESIEIFVQKNGWEKFRQLEEIMLKKALEEKETIVSTGGGIVDWQPSVQLLQETKNVHKIYIEKDLNDLEIQLNSSRPALPNFPQLFVERSKKYTQISDTIITSPSKIPKSQSYSYLEKELEFYLENKSKKLQEGYILCFGDLENEKFENTEDIHEISGVEIRVDLIAKNILKKIPSSSYEDILLHCRKSISEFKAKNAELASLPFIGTLRSSEELGVYPFMQIENKTEDYFAWLKELQKMPFDYIDCEFSFLKKANFPQISNRFNSKPFIFSYHGHSTETIHQLINMEKGPKDFVKICFNGSTPTWESNKQYWKSHSEICINLNNPLSRLENSYRMVSPGPEASIKIPTLKQLKVLGSLSKFFR